MGATVRTRLAASGPAATASTWTWPVAGPAGIRWPPTMGNFARACAGVADCASMLATSFPLKKWTSSRAWVGFAAGVRLTSTIRSPFSGPRFRARSLRASTLTMGTLAALALESQRPLVGGARDPVGDVDGDGRLLRRDVQALEGDPLVEPAADRLAHHRLGHRLGRVGDALEHEASRPAPELRQER